MTEAQRAWWRHGCAPPRCGCRARLWDWRSPRLSWLSLPSASEQRHVGQPRLCRRRVVRAARSKAAWSRRRLIVGAWSGPYWGARGVRLRVLRVLRRCPAGRGTDGRSARPMGRCRRLRRSLAEHRVEEAVVIPTMILFGLLLGRWWKVALVVGTSAWPVLLWAQGVIAAPPEIVGAAALGLANTAVGVMAHQLVLALRASCSWSLPDPHRSPALTRLCRNQRGRAHLAAASRCPAQQPGVELPQAWSS